MRIGIDARAYNWSGIGRYIRNLLAGLVETPHTYTVLLREADRAVFEGSAVAKAPNMSALYAHSSYYSWSEQTTLLYQLHRIPVDLWHFTHFNLPVLWRRPYVVTIHDTTRFVFPGQQRQDLWQQLAYEFAFRRAVEGARMVITVSDSTTRELQRLPFKAAPITMIYEGVDERFSQPVSATSRQRLRMSLGVQSRYILFVGVWMSHKNLERLVAAFARVAQAVPDVMLVITGRPKPGYTTLLDLIAEYDLSARVIFPGFVNDELLPALYAEATVFVLPSLYEGFGLPLLEAAAVGVPIITSDVTSMPELLGDSVVTVNPEDVGGLAGALLGVLVHGYSAEQVRIAQERARAFQWQHAVTQHVAVYETAISRIGVR